MPDNVELQSHWARYLCILTSAFLELALRELYGHYARQRSAPFVANYVERNLGYVQNPSMDRILTLAGSFSPEWASKLKDQTEGELKDAVDSVVANRNRIAHGEDVGITYARVADYYRRVVRVIEIVEEQCSL